MAFWSSTSSLCPDPCTDAKSRTSLGLSMAHTIGALESRIEGSAFGLLFVRVWYRLGHLFRGLLGKSRSPCQAGDVGDGE